MTIDRQRLLALLAVAAVLQGAVTLLAASPLLLDATIEAIHGALRACLRPVDAHYSRPATIIAALVVLTLVVGVTRMIRGCRHAHAATEATMRLWRPLAVPNPPARPAALARSLGLSTIPVTLLAPIPLAFCHGLRRPRIYVTTGMLDLLDDAELGAVLLHEDHHRRRREPLRLLLVAGAAHVLRFWRAAPAFAAAVRTDIEIGADAAAVRRSGVTPVARALYKVLCAADAVAPSPAGVAFAGLGSTEARIDALAGADMAGRIRVSWLVVAGGLVGFALGLALPIRLAAAAALHPILSGCCFG